MNYTFTFTGEQVNIIVKGLGKLTLDEALDIFNLMSHGVIEQNMAMQTHAVIEKAQGGTNASSN